MWFQCKGEHSQVATSVFYGRQNIGPTVFVSNCICVQLYNIQQQAWCDSNQQCSDYIMTFGHILIPEMTLLH